MSHRPGECNFSRISKYFGKSSGWTSPCLKRNPSKMAALFGLNSGLIIACLTLMKKSDKVW
jgi:hypothetical protein